MPSHVSPAASVLADIGHLLESVVLPAEQLQRAVVLLGRFVPYDRCALLDASSGASPSLTVVPAASPEEHDELRRTLSVLQDLVSDRPAGATGALSLPEHRPGVAHLAFPLVALDEAVGILMVERAGGEYEEQHLQLLAIVGAQLAGYLANVRLQSEEKRATRAMQRAADLLEHIRDGFLELDSAWTCVTANGAAADLLGLPRSEIVGSDIRALAGLAGRPTFVAGCERALRERVPVHVEAEQYGAQRRWLELELYPTELGLSVFLRDVGERQATEELRELLMGIIGHDLRTPLGAITVTASTLLRRGGLDGATERSIARIASSGARMTEMVSQLLDVTRIRFGEGLPIQRHPTDLAHVCHDVASELTAAHPDREIRCEGTGALEGVWDGARLSQVVSNLVANAIQHGDARAPVTLSAAPSGDDSVTISVHNEGPPIPAEMLPSIFEPFRQAGPKTLRNGGLGLGLFIARSIVQAHGGTIAVESRAGAGTTFTVRLPRR